MVSISPFIGTRYDTNVVGELGKVVCPPYDVITPPMQNELYGRDKHNFVRLALPKAIPTDDEYNNRYERAAQCFADWKKQGILIDDEDMSLYFVEQEFAIPGGRTLVRRGMFAAVQIEDGPDARIRPHEQTFPGPKEDRMKMLRATQCNLSPIFVLTTDPDRRIIDLLKQTMERPPTEVFADTDGIKTRLWVSQAANDIQPFQEALDSQDLLIADGHHRYETAKSYRREMRQALGPRVDSMPFDHVMMYIASMQDDGLVILPTHRALRPDVCVGIDLTEILSDIEYYFRMEKVDVSLDDPQQAADVLLDKIKTSRPGQIRLAMVLPKDKAYVLSLKKDVNTDDIVVDDNLHPAIRELDVTVLHHFIIKQVWIGNPEMDLDESDVLYSRDAAVILECVKKRQACVAFLVNAPHMEQVRSIANLGLLIPAKSTYFYPKIPSGIIVRDISRH